MAKTEEIRLGQHLIRKRWCSLIQVNQAFSIQRRLRDEGKQKPLGWILVQEGDLDAERLKSALAELGMLRLTCPSCRREVPVPNYNPQTSQRCSTCEVDLVIVEDDVSRSLDGKSFRAPAAGEARETKPGSIRPRAANTTLSAAAAPPESAKSASAAASEAEDPIIGKIIGGCQILSRIARGGMGVVYRGKQLKLGRIVAVKILSEELAKDRKYVQRFLREARSAAELNHGNIVHIIDVGELNTLFYIIMEYVDGSTLREILDVQRTLDPGRVLEICQQACQALHHAHKRGIIHRDIKPENIMITRDAVVKIADLGLAKKLEPESADGSITNTKAIMGTPFYMAPEQIKDFRQVDGRTDIYSLGVTMYKALTGAVPFEGRTPVEVMIRVVEGKRAAIRALNPAVPPDLEALVDRMMHRSPAERPQSFADVLKELDRVYQSMREQQAEEVSLPLPSA